MDIINKINPPFNSLLIGNTGSGKTNFMKFWWHYQLKNKFSYGVVLCDTNEVHNTYNSFVDKKYIHTIENNKDFKIFDKMFKKGKYNVDNNKYSFIIIDDMIGSINFKDLKFVKYMCTARHYNISIIILMQQYTTYMPPSVRENIRYTAIFKIKDLTAEHVYKLIRNKFKNYSEYLDFLNNRKKFQCIFLYDDIDTTEDKLCLITAPLIK